MITFSRMGYFGQLGNQLFQYAMLKGVAAKRGFDVGIPNRLSGYNKKRGLIEFAPLCVDCTLINDDDRRSEHRYCEPHFHFDPGVFEVEDETDLHGYFQSPRYFSHIAEDIRKEYQLRAEYRLQAEEYIRGMRCQSDGKPLVAVHVRRGDYLRSRTLRVLSVEYYRRAMDVFASMSPTYIFYSDDLDWCRLAFADCLVASLGDAPHFIQMGIASMCDHSICANSSFSWWASWLNSSPKKIVTVPQRWFGQKCERWDVSDLIPDGWIRLEG